MQRSLSKACDSYRLSKGYVGSMVSHRRALTTPMVGFKMTADPVIGDINNQAKTIAAALRERRACQYASAMGRSTGELPADQSALVALWDEDKAMVHFVTRTTPQRVYGSFAISERVMQFNADSSAKSLPAPGEAPETARCADTVDAFEAPRAPEIVEGEDICAILESMFAKALAQMVTA